MKSLLTLGILLISFNALSAEIVVKSDPIPTCYELPNTAIHTAIKRAEEKALNNCGNPVLKNLRTQIRPGTCGAVQVLATYECN